MQDSIGVGAKAEGYRGGQLCYRDVLSCMGASLDVASNTRALWCLNQFHTLFPHSFCADEFG